MNRRRGERFLDRHQAEALERIHAGEKFETIGLELGVHPSTVARYARKHGIARRRGPRPMGARL